jgi:hypothetical protein
MKKYMNTDRCRRSPADIQAGRCTSQGERQIDLRAWRKIYSQAGKHTGSRMTYRKTKKHIC